MALNLALVVHSTLELEFREYSPHTQTPVTTTPTSNLSENVAAPPPTMAAPFSPNPRSAPLLPPSYQSNRGLPDWCHSLASDLFGWSFPMTPGLCIHACGSRGFSTALPGSAAHCWDCGAGDGPFLACSSCRSVQLVDLLIDYFEIFGLEKSYELEDKNLQGNILICRKRRIMLPSNLVGLLMPIIHSLQMEGMHRDEEKTISDPELLAEQYRKFDEWSGFFGHAFKKQNFEEAKTVILRMTYYERTIQEIVKKL